MPAYDYTTLNPGLVEILPIDSALVTFENGDTVHLGLAEGESSCALRAITQPGNGLPRLAAWKIDATLYFPQNAYPIMQPATRRLALAGVGDDGIGSSPVDEVEIFFKAVDGQSAGGHLSLHNPGVSGFMRWSVQWDVESVQDRLRLVLRISGLCNVSGANAHFFHIPT